LAHNHLALLQPVLALQQLARRPVLVQFQQEQLLLSYHNPLLIHLLLPILIKNVVMLTSYFPFLIKKSIIIDLYSMIYITNTNAYYFSASSIICNRITEYLGKDKNEAKS
jgi:hypothetical protein